MLNPKICSWEALAAAYRTFVWPINIARVLIVMNVVAITRAFALVSLIELILVVLFVSNRELRKRFRATLDYSVVRAIFLFWVWVAFATLWAGDVSLADRVEEVWSWRKIILLPMAMSLFGLKESQRLFFSAALSVAVVFCVISWMGYFGVLELDRSPIHLLENHVTQSIYFALGMLLAFHFLVSEERHLLSQVGLILCIALLFLNIVLLSTGRSGYVAIFVAGLLVVYQLYALRHIGLLFLFTFMFVGGLIWSPVISERMVETAESLTLLTGYTSAGIRLVYWTNTIALIEASPMLGTGSGAFLDAYSTLVANQSDWRSIVTDDPHNQYLLIAAEQGLIGLALFGLFLYSSIIWLFKHRHNEYFFIGIWVLVTISLTSLVNGHFNTFVEGRLFFLVFGVVIAGDIIGKQSRRRNFE